jgi:hypothetical protein
VIVTTRGGRVVVHDAPIVHLIPDPAAAPSAPRAQ